MLLNVGRKIHGLRFNKRCESEWGTGTFANFHGKGHHVESFGGKLIDVSHVFESGNLMT